MKNAETSSEAPATLTSVKPASMKLVGKCVAQSHTSPSLWYSATCWRGNSWPLLGVEMMGPYFQCCEFFWWQSGAAALGTGFCLPVSEHRWNPESSRCLWATDNTNTGWCVTALEDLLHSRQRPIQLGHLSLGGEEKNWACAYHPGFSGRCPRTWLLPCLSWSPRIWDLAYSRCLGAVENKKIDGWHDDRHQREWETMKSWKNKWQIPLIRNLQAQVQRRHIHRKGLRGPQNL